MILVFVKQFVNFIELDMNLDFIVLNYTFVSCSFSINFDNMTCDGGYFGGYIIKVNNNYIKIY